MLEGLPPGVGSHGYESCVCVNRLPPWVPYLHRQQRSCAHPRAHQYSCVCVNSGDVGPSRPHISMQAATVGTISSLLPPVVPLPCVLRRIARERPSRSCRCTVTHPSGGDNLYAGLHCRARRAKPLGRIAYGSPKVFRHAFACLPHFGCSSGTLFICGLFSWRYRGISKRLFDFPHLTCYDGYMEHHIAPSFLATDS
jgi:hypothetical protein